VINVKNLLLHKSAPLYPLAFGVLIMLWGLWLLLPFSVFSTSPSYSFVSGVTSEAFLGGIAFLIGATQVYAVLTRNVKLIAYTAISQFVFWTFLFLSFVQSNWQSPGTVVYSWIALMNGLGHINWHLRTNGHRPEEDVSTTDKVS